MTFEIALDKTIIRHRMRQQRSQLSEALKKQAASSIQKQLLDHPVLKSSRNTAGYIATKNEIDIQSWFSHAWQHNMDCYLPIVLEHQLAFARYLPHTRLHPNRWGILEPSLEEQIVPPEALDVVLMPLLAFDHVGHRLGRGGGYYDRAFSFLLNRKAHTKPYLIGLGYQFQRLKIIEPADWDVPLQEVITETSRYQYN